jgi:hypothetical protein
MLVVLFLVAYPFSLGPVVWLLDRTQPNDRIMACAEVFYWPVLAVSDALPPVGGLVEGYIDWWSAATPAPANAPLPAPPIPPPPTLPLPATTITVDANGVERIGVDFTF